MRSGRWVAGVVVSVVLAACAGSSSGGSEQKQSGLTPLRSITLASQETQDAGSSRVALGLSMSGAGLPSSFHFTGRGAFDYDNQRGKLAMSIPSIAGQAGNIIVVLFDHTVVYERIPSMALAGKPWIKVDVSSAFSGAMQNGLFGMSSPDQSLQFLTGASDATDEGTATVRGVPVDHYRVNIDLSKAADRVPKALRSSFDMIEQALGTSTVPADVYVDEQGRMRRIHLTFDLDTSAFAQGSGSPPAGTVTFSETVDLFDFGVTVNVTPPPDSQVTDVSGLVGSGLSSSEGGFGSS